MKRLWQILTRRKDARPLDTVIARRALRLHNRSAEGAAKYERVQAILAQGRR